LEESKAMVAKGTVALTRFAEVISWLDVYTSHALFAHEKKYIQPELINNTSLVITGGRHPVIEAFLPRDQQFIPNDLFLNVE
jgi:DNA mismatch repair protein MutS